MGEADYLLTRQEVIAPAPHGHGAIQGEEEFAWVEVEASACSPRPSGATWP